MSHEVETMAWGVNPPWHGLGVQVERDISVDDMLVRAGLDWEVQKLPMEVYVNGTYQTVPDQFALTRMTDGSVLTTVGKTYQPIQNREALDFFREFVEAGDMYLDTAGSLQNGKRVWALAQINDGFTLAGGDEVRGFLLFTNPHVNGYSQTTMLTPIRVVCANTMAMALQGARGPSRAGVVRHPHFSKFDPDKVKETLGLARNQLASFKEQAEFLASKRWTDDSLARFMIQVFDPERFKSSNDPVAELGGLTVRRAMDAAFTQPGGELASADGTWWGALNAVTYLTDHQLGRNPDSRLASSWYGESQAVKLRASALAVEYARVA